MRHIWYYYGSPVKNQMSYFKKTLFGVFWISFLRGVIRIILLAKTAILARILLPEQFGAFGVAALTISFLEILTETGINVFLLQGQEKLEDYVSTAWVVSIIRGLLISLLIFLAAPLISGFFHISSALPLLYLIVAVPLLRGFINPACIRFQKSLQFHKEFFYQAVLVIVEVASTVIITLFTHSAIGIVWGLIISALVEIVLSFIVFRPRPKFVFDSGQAKKILSRGKWVTGFGIFDYLFTQGDNIIVGRLLGGAPLGIYQNAYKLSTTPLTEVMDVYYRVTFPVFSQMHRDGRHLKSAAIKSVTIFISLLILLGLLVFFLAQPLVLIILGPDWISAIPVVRVLAFLGVARGIAFSFNSVFLALHQQKYVTAITFISALGLAVTIIPAVRMYGLVGAGASAMFGSLLALPVALFFINRLFRKL